MPDQEPPEVIEVGLWDSRMLDVTERREAACRSFSDSVDWAKGSLDRTLVRLVEQQERLALMREDEVVLVRNTQGPDLTVYHSIDRPCGRVTGKSRGLLSFDKMLEGEARLRRLRRCGACSWLHGYGPRVSGKI